MSLIGDALELMRAAHGRAAVIRAVVHHWEDREVYGQTPQRWQDVTLGRPQWVSSVAISLPDLNLTEPPHQPRFPDTTQQVWRKQPGWYWRIEGGGLIGTDVLILSGNKYWRKEPDGAFETNVAPDGSLTTGGYGFGGEAFLRLLFDPASLLPVLDISEAWSERYIDRAAIRVTAHPRLDVDLVHIDWHYVTKHSLVVDAESGILLRYEAWLDDVMYMQWDLREVHLNEYLPDDFFTGPADAALIQPPDMTFANRMTDQFKELSERLMEEQRQTMEGLMRGKDESQPPNC